MSDLLTISGPPGSMVLLARPPKDNNLNITIEESERLFIGSIIEFPIILSSKKYPRLHVRVRDASTNYIVDYIYQRPTYGIKDV